MVLTDMMVSGALMVVLFGATLAAFNGFDRRSRANQAQNEAQDRVRVAVDRLSRDLRNSWIEKAEPYDLVGQSVDGALPASGNERRRERVRYCLDGSQPGARLWRQEQNWTEPPTPAMAPTDACPAPGWNTSSVVAQHITNRGPAGARPLFLYDTAIPADVDELRVELFVDVEPEVDPAESRLLSGVYLRNRNREPTPSFTATPSKPGYVLLNASFSTDPDDDLLAYDWSDHGSPIEPQLLSASGPVAEYGPVASGHPHQLTLTVRDPAGLETTSTPQTVSVP